MDKRQRLENAFAGEMIDRTPVLSGWLACPEHICTLCGIDLDTYWSDPKKHSIQAYKNLGVDGLIDIYVPQSKDDYRIVDAGNFRKADMGLDLDNILEEIEDAPDGDEIEAVFDFDTEYIWFRNNLIENQKLCGDLVYMPAQWATGAKLQWYDDYGYENFFMIVGAYPDHAQKLMEIGGAVGKNRCKLIARAVQEGYYPHAVLLGEDICSQRGPLVSPDFLEKYYAPQLRSGLEPLLEVGCKPVWHSDGDVRPLMDMLINCGIKGFQGFQPECGMTLDFVLRHKTSEGDPLIIFGPMAVTTELPVMSPDQVRIRMLEVVEECRDQARLVLFTSNTMNPDIPLENIVAMYEAVLNS